MQDYGFFEEKVTSEKEVLEKGKNYSLVRRENHFRKN